MNVLGQKNALLDPPENGRHNDLLRELFAAGQPQFPGQYSKVAASHRSETGFNRPGVFLATHCYEFIER